MRALRVFVAPTLFAIYTFLMALPSRADIAQFFYTPAFLRLYRQHTPSAACPPLASPLLISVYLLPHSSRMQNSCLLRYTVIRRREIFHKSCLRPFFKFRWMDTMIPALHVSASPDISFENYTQAQKLPSITVKSRLSSAASSNLQNIHARTYVSRIFNLIWRSIRKK